MSYVGNTPFTAAFLTDTFSGNGSTVAFTMSVAPATTSSVIVAITGVLQDPSTYSVSGTTLTFSAAPPTGTSNISVRYLGIPASGVTTTAYRTQTEFTATAGQTTFSVPSYTVGFIDVYRNGLLLGSSDFTATNGTTVVLTNAASAGDFVETVSFYVSSVLNALPTTGGTLSGNLVVNGDETISGNVGIGTASPNSKLEVTSRITASDGGGASRIALNIESNTSAQTYSAINSYNYGTSTARNLVLNESGGNVGIGTISPANKLTSIIAGNNAAATDYILSGGSATYQMLGIGEYTAANAIVIANKYSGGGNITFRTGSATPAEVMRIDSSGNLLVGTTTTGAGTKVTIKADATLSLQGANTTNTGNIYFLNTAGSGFWSIATNTSNLYIADADFTNFAYVAQNFTAWSFGSDRRIKQEIENIDYGLSTVMAIQSRRYKLASSGKVDIGFIAQELKEVVPEAVTGEEIPFDDADTPQERAGKIMGVSKETLIPVIVKAIQEQQAIITQLQADVAALKGNS